jgi:hypothetical protein
MIKHLPEGALEYLLRVLNRMYANSFFPDLWRESVIIPIPKPGKCHSDPRNYRPIALTSVLCKTMERMINSRLVDYLEMHAGLNNIQCGGRKCHSTTDHLVRLESDIRQAFVRGEHVISIFFDVEKAYDTTWKYGIMKDLHRKGLRGLLPRFIKQFLQNRSFKVKVGDTLSPAYPQEMGVPQGSVLSVTLFILKIDQLADVLPKDGRLLSSLYVDDLQISYRHPCLQTIQRELQECLNRVGSWASLNGFRFSPSKTKSMHFTIVPGLHLKPTLTLHNTPLVYEDSIKFLGLVWDPKLTWRPHIAALLTRCRRSTGIIRTVTSLKFGADTDTGMTLYRTLIRSRLDYGAVVYGSAARTTLEPLSIIANNAMRITTGAFRSTPIETLNVLANELPLPLRREKLSLQYYFKIRSLINNPALSKLTNISDKRLFAAKKNICPPLSLRVDNLMTTLDITRKAIRPSFSYRILRINTPTWMINPPSVNHDLQIYQLTSEIDSSYP